MTKIASLVTRFKLPGLAGNIACATGSTFLVAACASSPTARDTVDVRAVTNEFLTIRDDTERAAAVERLVERVRRHGSPFVDDTVAHLLHRGRAQRVSVAGDFNGWDPNPDTLLPIRGTDLFLLSLTGPHSGRFEYKFVVDGAWILDPLNSLRCSGGYGENSELRFDGYVPPAEIEPRADVPRGGLDTLQFRSTFLGRSHQVIVYLPVGYGASTGKLPVVFVTDGGEYLSLARMNTVLDNTIADARIPPVIAVFIDPRLDPRDSRTSKRMEDYSMSDRFVSFLADELRPYLQERYRISGAPRETGIIGASMGGLISTYAVFKRPEVFGCAGIQSPAYGQNGGAIFTFVDSQPHVPLVLYLETGTVRDAVRESREMRDLLRSKGYELAYAEYPEGHNWGNWRARLADMIVTFWGTH